ncbi:MAG: hypothetical protein H7A24_10670 [Leptospiraceae bacterium]|nr:hypothetical protein [Leptospiraceae bacterium]MCP5512334.1 hypothetical protein [Leptospiraceae bacterium]
MEELKNLEKNGNYEELISRVRDLVKEDVRKLEDPYVKSWLGKRWRNLFITEAAKDENAVAVATEKKLFGGSDDRDPRQKVALRYLRAEGPDEWSNEYPKLDKKPIQNTTLVFAPGLLTGLLPVMAFQDEFPLVESEFPIRILQSDSHPMRGCEANVSDLLNAIEKGRGLDAHAKHIEEGKEQPPGDIFIISYSKGTPDVLTLLSKRPDLKSRIKCIFNWAGAPGGSYLANSMYESLKDININLSEELAKILTLISPVIELPQKVQRLPEYDIKGAILDLVTTKREEFLEENLKKIDELNIPIFNITGSTTAMEVPYFQIQGVMELNKYDANNDMQVTQRHSKVNTPIATDLAMLHGHHWDISYAPFPQRMRFGSPNLDHPFPRKAALSAMILFAQEMGFIS